MQFGWGTPNLGLTSLTIRIQASRIHGNIPTTRSQPMCKKITCDKCGKPTWQGCGQHIEDALKDVPVAQRCDCPR